MAFDAHKNLAIATVTNSPGAAGVSLVVAGGEGARFPAVPFNATVWPATELPTPVNAEVVRVTAITTDTLTITRAQEGTTARAIVAGDLFAATITAKSLTDIESGVNFPLIRFEADSSISRAVNTGRLDLVGGIDGAGAGYISLFGNSHAAAGKIGLTAPGPAAKIEYGVGGALRGVMHPSGGFSWGGTTDPGAGNLSVNQLVLEPSGVRTNTPDGADNRTLYLTGGGAIVAPGRGAYVALHGNEVAGTGGQIEVVAGDPVTGAIAFKTGVGVERGRIHPSGGFSWGGTVDPGAGALAVGTLGAGNGFVQFYSNGVIVQGSIGGTFVDIQNIYHGATLVGYVRTTASGCSWNTISDARLKTSLSRHTDPSVLRNTVIHNFLWQSDGTPGRGVFAQEAFAVAPFAVSVGGDEVDDEGRLTKPWGVDYSKYVPDLITGWQDHDAELVKLRADVAILTQRLAWPPARSIDLPLPSVYQRIRAVLAGWFPAWITP